MEERDMPHRVLEAYLAEDDHCCRAVCLANVAQVLDDRTDDIAAAAALDFYQYQVAEDDTPCCRLHSLARSQSSEFLLG